MDSPPSPVLRAPRNIWLALAIVLVIAIAVYSYMDGLAFQNAAAGADRSRIVLERTHELLSLLKDAENGQRGYLLTGEAEHLAEYNQAVQKIGRAQADLSRMPDAGAVDQERLS